MIVTVEDHEAGFKDLDIEFRTGATGQVRLVAPCRDQVRGITLVMQEARSPWPLVRRCLPPPPSEAAIDPYSKVGWMDKLTPDSGDRVEVVAFALTFGNSYQKKMMELGLQLAITMSSPKPEAKSPSEDPASPSGK